MKLLLLEGIYQTNDIELNITNELIYCHQCDKIIEIEFNK